MATWVEDIIQALKNLGGQAHRKQILEEVKRIRKEPLPERVAEVIQSTIQNHSSDSTGFRGNDLFQKVGNGVWALREKGVVETLSQAPQAVSLNKVKNEVTSTWVEDIVQAITNLGGQATLTQIYEEVKRIRQGTLPKMWQHIIQDTIYQHSSDTQKFQGNDLFRKVDKGVWALRNHAVTPQPVHHAPKQRVTAPQNYLPPESFEEIANILRTIKQYRDYQHPNSLTWKEYYVDEFFHVLGFSTHEKNQRIMTLNLMGANHTPKAIVCYVKPGENFDEITPGLQWDSYLFYAAKFHQVEWGILTDGLKLKVIHFKDQDNNESYDWPDLDGIICKEKLDTFCTIYKVFSFIKGYASKPTIQGNQKKSQRGKKDRNLTERRILCLKFWGELLEKAKTKTSLHANVSPGTDNWASTSAGISGVGFNYFVRRHDAQIEVYMKRVEAEWNKMVFNALLQHKVEIEERFGGPLDWQLLPDKKACRIRFVISDYGIEDQDHWDELQDKLIDAMVRLERAFRPVIDNYTPN